MKKEIILSSLFKCVGIIKKNEVVDKIFSKGKFYKLEEKFSKNKKRFLYFSCDENKEIIAIDEFFNLYMKASDKLSSSTKQKINDFLTNIKNNSKEEGQINNTKVLNKKKIYDDINDFIYKHSNYNINVEQLMIKIKINKDNKKLMDFAKENNISVKTLNLWMGKLTFLRILFNYYYSKQYEEMNNFFKEYTEEEIEKFHSDLKNNISESLYISNSLKKFYLELILEFEKFRLKNKNNMKIKNEETSLDEKEIKIEALKKLLEKIKDSPKDAKKFIEFINNEEKVISVISDIFFDCGKLTLEEKKFFEAKLSE